MAVLFDLDGTLTDTEKLWELALADLAVELGGTLTDELRDTMVGMPLPASVAALHAAFEIDVPWRVTADRLTDLVHVHYRAGVPLRPGAREFLTAVREAGLRTALVTATEAPMVKTALETLGHEFDALVTYVPLRQGKVRMLRIPHRAVVVVDRHADRVSVRMHGASPSCAPAQ